MSLCKGKTVGIVSFASEQLRTAHHLDYLHFWNAGREEGTGCYVTGSVHNSEGIVIFETKVVKEIVQNLLNTVLGLLI